MDGNSNRDDAVSRDLLLYHNGHAYSLLAEPQGGCYHPQKLGTRENYRAFLDNIVRDPAMRHRLWLQALYWAAYFGEGVGHDFIAWLTEALFSGRLGLYDVVCTGAPRGEPKKPDEKQVRAAVSAVLDNTPWVAPIKSGLEAITGADLVTGEPVSRLGAVAGIALGLVPSGKLIAKGMKKISEKLGEKGLAQAQQRMGATTDPRFVKRYKGPDGMTRDNSKLTEREGKGTQDGNTRVAKDTQNRKQGSAEKNLAYAEKMLTKRDKIGKPSNRIGGPYTAQEMELWQEVQDKRGRKNHMSAHTNTESGQVRVFERNHKGNIVKQTDEFQLDDFAATKKKLIEEFGE